MCSKADTHRFSLIFAARQRNQRPRSYGSLCDCGQQRAVMSLSKPIRQDLSRHKSYPPTVFLTAPRGDKAGTLDPDNSTIEIFHYDSDGSSNVSAEKLKQLAQMDEDITSTKHTVMFWPGFDRKLHSEPRSTFLSRPKRPSLVIHIAPACLEVEDRSDVESIFTSEASMSDSETEDRYVWPETPEADIIHRSWSDLDARHRHATSVTDLRPRKHLSEKRRKYPRTMSSHHLHGRSSLSQERIEEAHYTPSLSNQHREFGPRTSRHGGLLTSHAPGPRSQSMPDLRINPEFIHQTKKDRSCTSVLFSAIFAPWKYCLRKFTQCLRSLAGCSAE